MTNIKNEFDLIDGDDSEEMDLFNEGGDGEHEFSLMNDPGSEETEDINENLERLPFEQATNIQNEMETDGVVISKSKIILIEKLLQNIRENNDKIIQLLGNSITPAEERRIAIGQMSDDTFEKEKESLNEESRIVEGVFDGESMIGPDGKQYSIPANYASKSKLVEGDIMKLTITDNGTFVYKQIGPIERRRVVGIIVQSESGNYYVVDEGGHQWRVLTASITYYKGQVGDEAVILVPKNGDSNWAALDNLVKKPE